MKGLMFMAKAKKLPSGNWRVQVFAGTDSNGKRIMKSFTAETKKEAEFLAAQFTARHKEPVSEMTVGKAIDKYTRVLHLKRANHAYT